MIRREVLGWCQQRHAARCRLWGRSRKCGGILKVKRHLEVNRLVASSPTLRPITDFQQRFSGLRLEALANSKIADFGHRMVVRLEDQIRTIQFLESIADGCLSQLAIIVAAKDQCLAKLPNLSVLPAGVLICENPAEGLVQSSEWSILLDSHF